MRLSVSWVASTAPWPARAWSEWPCVITALSTGCVGSIWKPPILQYTPAGVGRRISSGRIGLRYGVNGAMTGGALLVRQSARSVGTKPPALRQEGSGNETYPARGHRDCCGRAAEPCRRAGHTGNAEGAAGGGKSAIFYLPLSITERLGYFRDAGLA